VGVEAEGAWEGVLSEEVLDEAGGGGFAEAVGGETERGRDCGRHG